MLLPFALLLYTSICLLHLTCLALVPLANNFPFHPCLSQHSHASLKVRVMCGSAFGTLSCTAFKPLRLLSCIGHSVASCIVLSFAFSFLGLQCKPSLHCWLVSSKSHLQLDVNTLLTYPSQLLLTSILSPPTSAHPLHPLCGGPFHD
jgi:hypothetical protein